MLNNNPLLKRFVDDLLCAGVFLGLSALIILGPRPGSMPPETGESPVVLEPSAIQPAVTQDATVESFTASMMPTLVKAQ